MTKPTSGEDKPVTKAPPSHVIVTDDGGGYRAGKVLLVDSVLLTQLDNSGVKYREATRRERRLGGFQD